MRTAVALSTLLAAALSAVAQDARHVPSVDELIETPTLGGVAISPDGTRVAYTVTTADWKQDAFVSQIWIAPAAGGAPVQLTRGEKASSAPSFSPDGRTLAFLSSRAGDRNQVFAIPLAGGEAVQLTKSETAVAGFEWSPDGRTLVFRAPEADPRKDRKEHLGDYEVVRNDYSFVQLWSVDVGEALAAPQAGKARTKGRDYSVQSFSWSPDGSRIAFAATKDPDLVNGGTSDVYVLDLATDGVRKVVSQPGPDSNPRFSPDGKQIAFTSQLGQTLFYARNGRIAVVAAEGGPVRSLSDTFDENPSLLDWLPGGIFFSAARRTAGHLFRLDSATGAVTRVSGPDALIGAGYALSGDGGRVAFTAGSPVSVPELFVADTAGFAPRPLTSQNARAEGLLLGRRELLRWKSEDDAEIEGVLIRPADFDPAKKYPLLCVIHGGPTGVDRPVLLAPDLRYYPSDIWAAKGALILKVNYRGSAGYGEAFRTLNRRNLGVGDAWDVLSGIDHLVAKGWADPARLGCMGWSQGGYISAFLTTSTTRFKAISVGAGISNWATYYYNTDITPFTINYLGDDPVDDPAIYQKTSPMSYVKGAKTPTLIQHGENDRRVPIANAYELRQALEDRGVPVGMVVYKGFGHGITKPKAMRAVMQHNLAWFDHHVFGGPAPDLANPELPKK
ncbi:MAG: prolyl oligopeptidase family serine peptidase [Vicinamibacteria bacterium]